jgi:hypothetical protein
MEKTEELKITYEDKLNKIILKHSRELDEFTGLDIESLHGEMDDLLCELLRELGFSNVTEIYEKQEKWYA